MRKRITSKLVSWTRDFGADIVGLHLVFGNFEKPGANTEVLVHVVDLDVGNDAHGVENALADWISLVMDHGHDRGGMRCFRVERHEMVVDSLPEEKRLCVLATRFSALLDLFFQVPRVVFFDSFVNSTGSPKPNAAKCDYQHLGPETGQHASCGLWGGQVSEKRNVPAFFLSSPSRKKSMPRRGGDFGHLAGAPTTVCIQGKNLVSSIYRTQDEEVNMFFETKGMSRGYNVKFTEECVMMVLIGPGDVQIIEYPYPDYAEKKIKEMFAERSPEDPPLVIRARGTLEHSSFRECARKGTTECDRYTVYDDAEMVFNSFRYSMHILEICTLTGRCIIIDPFFYESCLMFDMPKPIFSAIEGTGYAPGSKIYERALKDFEERCSEFQKKEKKRETEEPEDSAQKRSRMIAESDED